VAHPEIDAAEIAAGLPRARIAGGEDIEQLGFFGTFHF
jgi:hypothetical protein